MEIGLQQLPAAQLHEQPRPGQRLSDELAAYADLPAHIFQLGHLQISLWNTTFEWYVCLTPPVSNRCAIDVCLSCQG